MNPGNKPNNALFLTCWPFFFNNHQASLQVLVKELKHTQPGQQHKKSSFAPGRSGRRLRFGSAVCSCNTTCAGMATSQINTPNDLVSLRCKMHHRHVFAGFRLKSRLATPYLLFRLRFVASTHFTSLYTARILPSSNKLSSSEEVPVFRWAR